MYSPVSRRHNLRNRRAFTRGLVAIGRHEATTHRPRHRHHWQKLRLRLAEMGWSCFATQHPAPASLWLRWLPGLEASAYLLQPRLQDGDSLPRALGTRLEGQSLPPTPKGATRLRRAESAGQAVRSQGRAGQAEMPFPRWAVDWTEDCRRPRPHRRGATAAVECLARRSSK